MGRKKLTIQKLECLKARQAKYSKRKSGLLKKAKELSVLCDVDVAVVTFSPSGKPTLFVGQNKELSTIVDNVSCISVEDREERRIYTMKLLKKMQHSDKEAEDDPARWPVERVEALRVRSRLRSPGFYLMQKERLEELKERLNEKRRILWDWKHPDGVDDLAKIRLMEDHLIATLHRVRTKKMDLLEQKKLSEATQIGIDVEMLEEMQNVDASLPGPSCRIP